MELTKVYFFLLTVLTNFSLDVLAQDTFFSSTTTTDSSEDGTQVPSTTAAAATVAVQTIATELPVVATTTARSYANDEFYANNTVPTFDKSLLRTTEASWEPVDPNLRFGGLGLGLLSGPPPRRGRPKCCRRVRENEKKEARQLNCKNGSILSRDARGRRRRKCRRRNRCKRRCKQHYKNTAWGIVGTVMKGLDFFVPKLEFKFHTGTLVLGTKFFSGLVPFIQAKMQAMRFFYEIFEPMLDGVLGLLDFGTLGFRAMDLADDDDDDDDEDNENGAVDGNAVVLDEKYDAEKVDDYDDSDIMPDILLAKTEPDDDFDAEEEDSDDEGYESPKEDEPVDEDYGIDEDWDSDDDDEDEDDNVVEDEDDEQVKLLSAPKRRRPLKGGISPTRKKTVPRITAPTRTHTKLVGDQQMIQDFMNRIKDEDLNFTVYHSNIAGSHKKGQNKDKPQKTGSEVPFNDTHVLNVDNLVLNINAKPGAIPEELYEDDVEYQEGSVEDLDDKLIEDTPKPYKRVKSRPPIFSSFGAFFGAVSEAFDNYFAGTY